MRHFYCSPSKTISRFSFCRSPLVAVRLVRAAILIFGAVLAGALYSQCQAQNLYFGSLGYPTNPNFLFTSDLDGNGLGTILPGSASPVGIDADPQLQRVFWLDNGYTGNSWSVRSASLAGAAPTVISTNADGGGNSYGLALDTVNKQIYWADGATATIRRANYNGSGSVFPSVVVATNVGATSIEVDPAAKKIFWTNWGNRSVETADLSGNNRQTLVSLSSTSFPTGITVDPRTSTVFYSEYNSGIISTIPYTGGLSTPLFTGLTQPLGLDLELTTNRLYLVQGTQVDWALPTGGPLTNVFTPTPGQRGEMYDITAIIRDPEPVTLSGLRNFDVVSAQDVNDFHITMHGISDPRVAANGGTQILGTFPAPFNNVSGAPTGWYPPSISSSGNTTVVSYGGPGAQFIPGNQTLHFGVSLTPKGEKDLDAICMHWTRDGMPLDEADVNIPITIITDQAAPGETDIQIVNQICPDDPVTPPRWLGPIHLSVVDRHANLDELVAASPIIEEASVFYDGNTYLQPGEQFTLTDFDAAAPIAPGQSVVVWYNVFADNGGMPGTLVGTSYSAFNVSAVPEPATLAWLAIVAIVAVYSRGREV